MQPLLQLLSGGPIVDGSHGGVAGARCTFEYLQRMLHSVGEEHGIFLAAKVQSPHLSHVPPLVEARCGLVILQALGNRAVDHHLLVLLNLAPHHTEGVAAGVVVDVDTAEDLGPGPRWDPLLVGIIVDHHSGSGLADTGLTHVQLRWNLTFSQSFAAGGGSKD